jgi:hypothetical protein
MSTTRVGRYSVVGTLTKGVEEDVLIGEQGSRRVAIRLFNVKDPETLLTDARKVAGLSHANIAPHEVGLSENLPFLAAELGGTPLDTWSGEDHSLSEQLLVVEGIAASLAHAHAEGVVHGRLTPARVNITPEGAARVWGFGLKGTSPDRSAPAYTAPEVLEGGAPGPQADVYSAGVLFYEVLTGQTGGDSPKPLKDARSEVSKDLADAIMACGERAVDWRPKDLDYLIEVVRKARGTLPAPKPKPSARPAFDASPSPSPRPGAPRGAAPERSGPPILPIAVGAVLLLGGAGYFFLMRGGPSAKSAEVTTTTATTTLATPPPTEPSAPPTTLAARALPAAASTAPAAATPTPTPAATPTPRTTPPPTTLATPPPTLAPVATTLPPVTAPPATQATAPSAPDGPAVVRAVSPPTLRRGQKTLVDVRGQNLYPGLAAALLRGGRPAEGLRVLQQRFVNATLVQVFIEVDAQATPGPHTLLLSDGQSVTNATRFDVAK